MTWIEPLTLETWIINIFSGSPSIFLGIALIALGMFAGFFRMTGLSFFFMVGVFLLMFAGFTGGSMIVLMMVFSGLILGYIIANILTRY